MGFNTLQNNDQPWENYVLFLAYLRQKDPNDYTGPESEISRKLKSFDSSWFPHKTSFQIQLADDLKRIKLERKQRLKEMRGKGKGAALTPEQNIEAISKDIAELRKKIKGLARLDGTNVV